MTETPIRDWMLPKLAALIVDAEAQGFNRDAIIAVITDIIEGPEYNTAIILPEGG
jgi:hypothetical protein